VLLGPSVSRSFSRHGLKLRDPGSNNNSSSSSYSYSPYPPSASTNGGTHGTYSSRVLALQKVLSRLWWNVLLAPAMLGIYIGVTGRCHAIWHRIRYHIKYVFLSIVPYVWAKSGL
jgi:hypothetical protein